MKSNPPTPEDAPMVATLTRLGIVGEFDFSKLPTNEVEGLSRVPEAARKKILGHYANQKQVNGWIVTTGNTGSGHTVLITCKGRSSRTSELAEICPKMRFIPLPE